MKKSTVLTIKRFFSTTLANVLNIYYIIAVVKETKRLKEICHRKNNFYNKSNYITQIILASLIIPYWSFRAFKYTYDSIKEVEKMRREEKEDNKKEIVKVPVEGTDFHYWTCKNVTGDVINNNYDPNLDDIQIHK